MNVTKWLSQTYQHLYEAMQRVTYADHCSNNQLFTAQHIDKNDFFRFGLIAAAVKLCAQQRSFFTNPERDNIEELMNYAQELKTLIVCWQDVIEDSPYKQEFTPVLECIRHQLQTFNANYH
ncbi:MAG: hypothetical protein KIT27_07010 [Legionellales bacterium]|nr:hypothetical protein [Legionellales bacterium]